MWWAFLNECLKKQSFPQKKKIFWSILCILNYEWVLWNFNTLEKRNRTKTKLEPLKAIWKCTHPYSRPTYTHTNTILLLIWYSCDALNLTIHLIVRSFYLSFVSCVRACVRGQCFCVCGTYKCIHLLLTWFAVENRCLFEYVFLKELNWIVDWS